MAGWIIKTSLDSGKIVDSWNYVANDEVLTSCLPGEKSNAGIMLTAIDDSTGIIAGTIMRWISSETQQDKCVYTRDPVILREGILKTIPISKPKCCKAFKRTLSEVITWSNVPTPEVFINSITFNYHSSLPIQLVQRSLDCTGVIKERTTKFNPPLK